MKPFLILQLRPEDEASDNEYQAFLKVGGLTANQAHRIRIEREEMPPIDLNKYSGVIVGGGPYCVSDAKKPREQIRFEKQLHTLFQDIYNKDFPYLGACYGIGILSQFLGGEVSKEKYGEGVGAVTIKLSDLGKRDPLFYNLGEEFKAFGGHKEACQKVPDNAVLLGGSDTCPIQIIKAKNNIYATQFHTELDSDGLALRINIYKHAGYFPAQEAEQLIALAKKEDVTEPEKIFRNFIDKYKKFN